MLPSIAGVQAIRPKRGAGETAAETPCLKTRLHEENACWLICSTFAAASHMAFSFPNAGRAACISCRVGRRDQTLGRHVS